MGSNGLKERTSVELSKDTVTERLEQSEIDRILQDVVAKYGLSREGEGAFRRVSAGPPEGKPKPQGEDVDEFLDRLETELWDNQRKLGQLSLDPRFQQQD